MATVRWGVLSTASIGRVVVEASRQAERARFVAVASRDVERAETFAAEMGLADAYGSYGALLAADDVDAIYVPLPVALHTPWTIAALEAGKHVLCEKPFAMTAADAARCFEVASAADRLVVEGLMYRHHPQTTLARRLLDDGVIGQLALVRAALSVRVEPGDIRRSGDLGGGALLDLGCYCVSAIRFFAGEPRRVYAASIPDHDERVDLRLAASLALPERVLGQLDVGLDLTRRDELELIGTDGRLTIPDPWLCRPGIVELSTGGGVRQLDVDPDHAYALQRSEADAYRIELDAVSAAMLGEVKLPHGRDDAVAQASVLEALRTSAAAATPVDLAAA